MTDNEIIKALECCRDLKCSECPKKTNLFVTDCDVKLCDEVLDLIYRQKAEIERLKPFDKKVLEPVVENLKEIELAKSEAYKEFAEEFEKRCIASGIYPALIKNILKNLVKELTEGSND